MYNAAIVALLAYTLWPTKQSDHLHRNILYLIIPDSMTINVFVYITQCAMWRALVFILNTN